MADRDRYPIHVRYLGDATPSPVLVRHDGMPHHCDVDSAARLLAGLEVALAAALREAGRGRCLHCGRVEGWLAGLHASGPDVVVHCGHCGGVLAPVAEGRGEGSMADSVIAPFPPHDGREWDCQCARCGSSAGYVDAEDGGRGLYACLSDDGWCEAHPIKGRESTARGEIEWFVVPTPPAGNGEP